jgi:hypothetical protein
LTKPEAELLRPLRETTQLSHLSTFTPRAIVLGDQTGTMGVMRTDPQPSDGEVLAGLVERVTYQNAENGFCVLRVKARGHRDLVTVVGHAAVQAA